MKNIILFFYRYGLIECCCCFSTFWQSHLKREMWPFRRFYHKTDKFFLSWDMLVLMDMLWWNQCNAPTCFQHIYSGLTSASCQTSAQLSLPLLSRAEEEIKMEWWKTKTKLKTPSPSVSPSSQAQPNSWLLYLVPPEWCKELGNWCWSQSITVPPWHYFFLTLFPCFVIGPSHTRKRAPMWGPLCRLPGNPCFPVAPHCQHLENCIQQNVLQFCAYWHQGQKIDVKNLIPQWFDF